MAKTYTMAQYNKAKADFLRKHSKGNGIKERGGLDGDTIHKIYECQDGGMWHEITQPITETIKGMAHGLDVVAEVQMYRTEIWDTDNSTSRYLYEVA